MRWGPPIHKLLGHDHPARIDEEWGSTFISITKPANKGYATSWFRQMAHALCNIHDRSVIVADIACRNLLLDSSLAIKFCDFTESTIIPQDTDMETADDNGYSIQTDIGQFGKVIYEVVTGEHCTFDLHENDVSRATWPRRETLPSTEEIWLGPTIEKCWTWSGFKDAAHLAEALDALS